MAECYLCYERNSPDIAEELLLPGNYDGSITGYRVMSSFERALAWLMSSIMNGIDEGFHLDKCDTRFQKNFDFNEFRKEFTRGSKVTVTMFFTIDGCDDDENTRWYDIVIETKELE